MARLALAGANPSFVFAGASGRLGWTAAKSDGKRSAVTEDFLSHGQAAAGIGELIRRDLRVRVPPQGLEDVSPCQVTERWLKPPAAVPE